MPAGTDRAGICEVELGSDPRCRWANPGLGHPSGSIGQAGQIGGSHFVLPLSLEPLAVKLELDTQGAADRKHSGANMLLHRGTLPHRSP